MGRTCTTHETDEKCIKKLFGETERKRVHSDLTENVRISEVQLTEGSEDVDCACSAQGPPEVGSCEHGDEI